MRAIARIRTVPRRGLDVVGAPFQLQLLSGSSQSKQARIGWRTPTKYTNAQDVFSLTRCVFTRRPGIGAMTQPVSDAMLAQRARDSDLTRRITYMAARPLVRIVHGGGGSLAAPNSIEGIERSLSYDLEMIEIDVRCTRDGRLVLSHDDVVQGARISDLSFDELRRRDSGVSALDDAFDLVRGRTTLNLDIKDASSMARIGSVVRAHGALDECVVSCLEGTWLQALADLEPTIPVFLSYPADRGGASQKPWLKP